MPTQPENYHDSLPIADHNSDLERQSLVALHACLPLDRFLVREVRGNEDYGVDVQIELRSGRQVTNLVAQVQLKATDRTARIQDDVVTLQVPRANLNYLTNGLHGECALYVLYLAATKELRFVWAADERRRIEKSSPEWQKQGTVTLKFGPQTLSAPSALDEIYNRITSHNSSVRSTTASVGGERMEATRSYLHDEEDERWVEGDPHRLVDVGKRIKAVRKDLCLDLPQFARALSHPDQRALARVELGADQAPLWLVRGVAELSGARVGWIELGTAAPFFYRGRRYPVRSIGLHRAPEELADILARTPTHLYLCLEPWSKQVVVLVEQTQHHWLTYDLCRLDFWNWQGSRYQIPKVRAFLQGAVDVQKTLVNYSSCYLNPITMHRILAGDVHPRRAVVAAVQRARARESGSGRYWTEDFVDIHGERDGVEDTEADYAREYGNWFVIARELMWEWDGAVHPFERMRRADIHAESDVSAENTSDTDMRPFARQHGTTHRTFAQSFSATDYGGPINLLPRYKRPQLWWRFWEGTPNRWSA